MPAIESFSKYAAAYRDASRLLVREFSERRGYTDYDVCPILYLYRHSSELYMKAIIIDGSRVLKADGKDGVFDRALHLKEHRLKQLIPAVKRVGEHVGWDPEGLAEVLEWPARFDTLLDQVDGMDPASYTHRYPVNTKGQASVESHHQVSIFHYALIAESLLEGLEDLHGRIESAWDAISEARYSMPGE